MLPFLSQKTISKMTETTQPEQQQQHEHEHVIHANEDFKPKRVICMPVGNI